MVPLIFVGITDYVGKNRNMEPCYVTVTILVSYNFAWE